MPFEIEREQKITSKRFSNILFTMFFSPFTWKPIRSLESLECEGFARVFSRITVILHVKIP